MAGVVEFVVVAQVRPALVGLALVVPAVQVAVGRLRPGEVVDDRVDLRFDFRIAPMRQRVARRLDPFADVESQKICMVKPCALRGIVSGGTGFGSFSDARMPTSSSLPCWLGMVWVSTVSSRSRQKSPFMRTSANGTAEYLDLVMLAFAFFLAACAARAADDEEHGRPARRRELAARRAAPSRHRAASSLINHKPDTFEQIENFNLAKNLTSWHCLFSEPRLRRRRPMRERKTPRPSPERAMARPRGRVAAGGERRAPKGYLNLPASPSCLRQTVRPR